MIDTKTLVRSVTFIARKKFIASVTRQQGVQAIPLGKERAVIGGDGRGIRERLVIKFDEPWYRFHRILRAQAQFVMS